MVQRMKQVVAEYEDRLRKIQSLPRFSYGRGMLRKDGAPSRLLPFVQFLHIVAMTDWSCELTLL